MFHFDRLIRSNFGACRRPFSNRFSILGLHFINRQAPELVDSYTLLTPMPVLRLEVLSSIVRQAARKYVMLRIREFTNWFGCGSDCDINTRRRKRVGIGTHEVILNRLAV